ncbi:hypothetical protein AOC36_00565 [Erysipelothrix larvae]|uniref:Uncharacterized protein n=1 Tax=Erysipelothrix larvae TaxID=1514105 RepID=A0A109UGD2_9FIRM|nr:glucose-1-phosphate adenylyltransferase subunit GlgD [Erysipelothrix larvae]AMC92537.1 hypothetical protein AOC36_00565 [Erysipelothrix larvae]
MRISKVCAIINLAGQEVKLKPLTDHRPIAALPFDGRYRIIDFMLSSVSQANLESVAIFIEESGRSIYDHIRSGRDWDLDGSLYGGVFTYSHQRRKLADYLIHQQNESFYENHMMFTDRAYADYVVIMEGDAVHNIDLVEVLNWHEQHEGEITVAYKKMPLQAAIDAETEAVYVIGDDKSLLDIELMSTVSEENVAVDCGVYVINRTTLFDIFETAEREGYLVDIGSLVRANLTKYPVRFYEYEGYLAKITSVQAYYDANMSMLRPEIFDSLHKGDNCIVTRSKSGAPTYYGENAVVKNAQIATGCIIEGHVENSIISRKTLIEPEAFVGNSVIGAGAKVKRGSRIEYAILDKGVVVESGVQIVGTADNPIVISKKAHIQLGDKL